MGKILAASNGSFPLYSFGYSTDGLLEQMSSCYALCAFDNGVSKMIEASVPADCAIGSLVFCRELFEDSLGYGTLASSFKAMENDVSTRCSSYLGLYPVSLAIERVKGWGMFTESNVAKDRICCSLHGNREQRADILSSFGREKRGAIVILRIVLASLCLSSRVEFQGDAILTRA